MTDATSRRLNRTRSHIVSEPFCKPSKITLRDLVARIKNAYECHEESGFEEYYDKCARYYSICNFVKGCFFPACKDEGFKEWVEKQYELCSTCAKLKSGCDEIVFYEPSGKTVYKFDLCTRWRFSFDKGCTVMQPEDTMAL